METQNKIFCERCHQRLLQGKKLLGINIKKGMTIYEFKDGFYCENCGKVKVEEARKNNGQGKN